MKTQLKNRTLWFDGTSEVAPELVPELLLAGVPIQKIVVTELNDDVLQFNALSDLEIAHEKLKNAPFDFTWDVPEQFMTMNFKEYVQEQLTEFLYVKSIPKDKWEVYRQRTAAELEEIRMRGMEPLFKTLVYVISKFKETGTFWGVGRGSSCASLVLYLIGLHKVDPVKFSIPMEEFFHD